jgi:hypothetical protein
MPTVRTGGRRGITNPNLPSPRNRLCLGNRSEKKKGSIQLEIRRVTSRGKRSLLTLTASSYIYPHTHEKYCLKNE